MVDSWASVSDDGVDDDQIRAGTCIVCLGRRGLRILALRGIIAEWNRENRLSGIDAGAHRGRRNINAVLREF